jgi:hypothetical protein
MPEKRGKRDVLKSVTFGQRIAEEEGDALASYFVETDQWRKVLSGEVDIVYGPKGSGKSAIYSLLLASRADLNSKSILVAQGENPRGTPVFKDLVADPPASEVEFTSLWKLYFLSLIGSLIKNTSLADSAEFIHVVAVLEESGLIAPTYSLRRILKSALDYVRRLQLEGTVELDPITGTPKGFGGKITIREPGREARKAGMISADELLQEVNDVLANRGLTFWIALDRLDVAFAESETLEGNALRALFKVYLDLASLDRIRLKIFLRDDIWKRVTASGFREASHITRYIQITWDSHSLLNLIIRRALHNEALRGFYAAQASEVLSSTEKQRELFYRIFPQQVDAGARKPSTLDWMLSRTADATRQTAPREVIHLLSSARDVQLQRLELGYPQPPEDNLFDRAVLKEAMPEVSKVRFEQTLCAEYPQLAVFMRKLENEKTEQTAQSLARIWGVKRDDALATAERLVEIGFFERRGTKEEPSFWIPFIYRDALRMLQGPAE